MRADGVTGYVSQFQVYIDKEVSSETGLEASHQRSDQYSLRQTFCDNFFTIVKLFHHNFTGMVSMPLPPLGQTGMASLRPVLKTHVKKGLRERIRNSKVKSTLTSQLCMAG